MKIGLVSVAAMAALALSQTAFAQAPTPSPKPAQPAASAPAAPPSTTTTRTSDYVEQATEGSQVVTFGNDKLDGDPLSAYGFTMRRPPGVLRAGLIRPRMNFVPELL